MQNKLKNTARLVGLAASVILSSCYAPIASESQNQNPGQPKPVAVNLPKPGPRGVSVSGRLVYSADETRPPVDRILESARQSIAEGGGRLDQVVQRWPDVAAELLRQSAANQSDVPVRLAIAESYDRMFSVSDPAAGWHAALVASESQLETYARFRTAREGLLALFGSGQFAQAARVDAAASLPADAPPAWRTEALRLAGLAALLDEKPDRAAEIFSRAARSAEKGPRHTQFEIALLLSESHRRRGQSALALEDWNSAVNMAAAGDVRDPDLWERAILYQLPGAKWPAGTAVAVGEQPGFAAGAPPELADVLIDIGMMRLSRGAPQPALLAFSRAEAETAISGKKALARLYRVQSMIELHQSASALPMLEALVQGGDRRIALHAQAIQGDLLCRELNDRQHGIPLLQQALESPNVGDWQGKTAMAANLGLYYLLEGRDEEGLQRLHWAEARFEAQGQWEDLATDLKNEAAFLRVDKKLAEAEVVQKRADDVCRRAGLAIGPLMANESTSAAGETSFAR